MFKTTSTKPVPAGAQTKVEKGKTLARIKVGGRWLWCPVNASGRVTVPSVCWYARVDGELVRLSPDKGMSETILAAKRLKAERVKHGIELPDPAGGGDLDGLVTRFIADRLRRGLTPRSVRWQSSRLRRVLAALKVDTIEQLRRVTADQLETWVSRHRAAPGTVGQDLSALRVFLLWLRKLNLVALLPSFPAVGRKVTHKRAAFTPALVAQLVAASPPQRAIFWRFLFATGARVAAALALTVEDLHLDAGAGPWVLLKGENSKTGKTQAIPLPEKLAKDLATFTRTMAAGERLFALTHAERHLAKDLANAGIERDRPDGKLVVHSMRHGATTEILKALPQSVALSITGHTDSRMLETYSHVQPHDGAAALRQLFKEI